MDPCSIAELELEEFQTNQWYCKLMFKPSLYDSIPEVDILNFINPPVGISNKGTYVYPSGYLKRFPPATMVWTIEKNQNLTYTTVATNVDLN
jgi:hypothetical protein